MPIGPLRVEHLEIDDEWGRIDGLLRTGPHGRSETVVVRTHPWQPSHANLSAWPMADLAGAGIDTFAFNNRSTGSAGGASWAMTWEPLALDVAAAIAEMRRHGYESVVLYGSGAGGALVAFYQLLAERGSAAVDRGTSLSGFAGFQERGDPAGRERQLPPADGIILQNSTVGPAWSFLVRLDGAVVDEATGRRDPALDIFEPANGYDSASGSARYSAEFLRRYYRAQSDRMARLVETVLERRETITAGRGRFPDDDLIVIPGTRADPAAIDLELDAQTRRPWPLHPGGEPRFVSSGRALLPEGRRRNESLIQGAAVHTLQSFLSCRAIRVWPGGHDPGAVWMEEAGVVLDSSNASTPAALAGVTVPVLVTAGTADTQVRLSHAELLYNSLLNAPDRQLAFVAGGGHEMAPAIPGAENPLSVHRALVLDWLRLRYR